MGGFGLEELGSRAFDLDRSKMALQGAETQNAQAMAQLHGTQNQEAQVKLEQQKKFNQLLQNAYMTADQSPDKGPVEFADQLRGLAGIALRAGLGTEGQNLAKTASILSLRAAREKEAQAATSEKLLNAQAKEADAVGRIFADVKSQDEWDQANAVYQFQFGNVSPYLGQDYDPKTVEKIVNGALSIKDRADIAAKKLRANALETYRGQRLEQGKTEEELRRRRVEVEEAREQRLAKAGKGEKGVTKPDVKEIDQAKRLILKDYPELLAAGDAAFQIASEAKGLMKANMALDSATAIGQAYAASVQRGDFQTDGGIMGSGLKKKTTFAGQGRTPQTAMKAAVGMTPIEGRYYIGKNGSVAQWTGKAFRPVSAPTLSGNNRATGSSSSADDLLDETDDEGEND